jgi:site-specific DNA recombinase
MKQESKANNPILKDILAGRYRNYFLVYGRRSTDEPDSQKNSIPYQKSENTKFAQRQKLPIAPITLESFCLNGIISEKHSGFKGDDEIKITADGFVQYRIERPKFQQLVQYLSRGLFKGVVCLCWDRISRNSGDNTILRKLMRKGIDVRFAYASYDNTSAGHLHMDIDGMVSEHHSRVTAEKVSIATRNLRERGVCTYMAPIGYLNKGTMEHKPFDPIRAPIIRRMFQLVVSEQLSLSDVAKWANKQGLTMPPCKRRRTKEEMLAEEEDEVKREKISRPMTANSVHRILTNPFYTGKIRQIDGKYIPSVSHEALVTEIVFNQAQQVLKRKRVSVRYVEKLDLPGRGLVRCRDCGRVYTPYIQKGIQYFSSRCRANCPNPHKNFNIGFLEKEIGKTLKGLVFTDAELAEIEEYTKSDVSVFEKKRLKELEEYERRKKKVIEDLAYLRGNKLSLLKAGVYSPESFIEQENKLDAELATIQDAERISQASMNKAVKNLVGLSELLKDGSNCYSFADSLKKERIAHTIFSELSISGNILIYQCKNGFKALQSRFNSSCGELAWLSEATINDNLVQEGIHSLTEILTPILPQAP